MKLVLLNRPDVQNNNNDKKKKEKNREIGIFKMESQNYSIFCSHLTLNKGTNLGWQLIQYIKSFVYVEVCVAERLTPRTPDLEFRGSSLTRRVVSLDKKLYSTLSVHPSV